MKIYRIISFAVFTLVALIIAGSAGANEEKKLYLYNWSQYMPPSIIKTFEKKYHVHVIRSFYDDNPEMMAKLRAGGDSQYDVVFPSGYYAPRLIQAGLIQPLDLSEIPNISNLMPRFRNPAYDPHSRYTAAYQWGDNGIIYNARKLPNAPKSWAILFDPSFNKKFPFALDTGPQGPIADACAYQGRGYNCASRDNWKQGAKLVLKTKKRANFIGFIKSTPVINQLIRGNVVAAVTNNGDYAFLKKRNPKAFKNIKFILPKEGSELWVDVMAIPAHAPHPKLANEFINFILNAEIGAKLSNWNAYATPNKASQPLLNAELQKPPITPTKEQMERLHFLPRLKGDQLQFLQQLWTDVLAR